MAYKCENCKKGIMVGRQHKHHPGVAGGRWKKRAPQTRKVFKPNLHLARVFINGAYKRMKLCTKCLRILKGKEILRQGPGQAIEPTQSVAQL